MFVFVNANTAGPTEACGVVLRASAAWVRELLDRQGWVRGLAGEQRSVREVVFGAAACRFVGPPEECDDRPGGEAGWAFLSADEADGWETAEDEEFGWAGVAVSRSEVRWRVCSDWSGLAVAETDPVGRDELESWLARLEGAAAGDGAVGPPGRADVPKRND